MEIDLNRNLNGQVAFITGGAQRLGAMTARFLHAAGANIIVHYRNSSEAAQKLCEELNNMRKDSASKIQADLLDTQQIPTLIDEAKAKWGSLDILINNASSFYPTPVNDQNILKDGISEQANTKQWDDLMGSNLKAPFFLSQACSSLVNCIVNIVDIHSIRPMAEHSIYNMAKAGLAMQVKTMARELGPSIRVNGISPGAILWPESETAMPAENKKNIIQSTYLKRQGTAEDIARTVLFLVRDADYITGQIIAVDGGRSLSI